MVSKAETSIIQVVTTTETREDAERIARTLVEKRLAACAQVSGPIKSYYWWKEEVEAAEEWQCKLKTSLDKYKEVEKALCEIHPYDVPQILALPVVEALEDYAKWLRENLGP